MRGGDRKNMPAMYGSGALDAYLRRVSGQMVADLLAGETPAGRRLSIPCSVTQTVAR
jgi:hypothetical protein